MAGKRRVLRELNDLDSVAPAAGQYVGPMPPNGLYRVQLTRLVLSEDRNGDDRFRASLKISHDPDAPKAKFNGAYGDWSSSVNTQGKPHIRAFADAFGFSAKEMANPLVDENDNVLKLGGKTVGGQMARCGLKKRTYTKSDGSRGESMEAKSCAPDTGELDDDPVGDVEPDDEFEDDEYGADEEGEDDTFTGDDEDEETEEDDTEEEEGEEGEDDEYEDDEEAEPEPAPARRAVKAPPAKAAPAKKAPAKKAAPAKATAGRRTKPF